MFQPRGKKKFRLGILVVGGCSVGMGHVSRCISLVRILTGKTQLTLPDVCFIFEETDEITQLSAYIEAAGLGLCAIRSFDFVEKGKLNFDVLIVDRLQNSKENIKNLRILAKKLVLIDDVNCGYGQGDMCVNPLYPPTLGITETTKNTKLFVGPEFHIPRPEMLKNKKKAFHTTISKIGIMQGGTDPNCCSLRIAKAVNRAINKKFSECKIIIFSGPFNDCEYNNESCSDTLDNQISILRDSPVIVDEMLSCDLVISAVGVTALDLCQLRVPSVFITSIPEEFVTGKALMKLGITQFFGRENEINLGRLERFIAHSNYQYFCEKFVSECDKLFDGTGLGRVIETLEEYLEV